MPDGAEWPRISIVTPSYNQGAFLEETIRSVLLQGYPNLEYFVIDGGSSDRSVEIIRKYELWLTGWVSEKDSGQSHAINKGFKKCTGDLITFQNSDDFYPPGTFESAARLWSESAGCGAVVGGFQRCDGRSNSIGESVPAFLQPPMSRDLTLGPPGTYRLHQVSTFFSRRTLDAVGRFVELDFRYVMDRELLYRVCRHSAIVLSPRCYGVFRLHDQSKTVSSVLPFAREFAQLYLNRVGGNPREDRLRKRMARYRIGAGYLKAAKATPRALFAAWYLLMAAASDRCLLEQRSYLRAWFAALHLRKPA
jgi:glycosyltransferase involved in cell wall biosynthesis